MFKKFFRNVRQRATILALVSLAFLAACQPATINSVEAGIDTAALTALTSQKVVLKHPCTETVTTLCADKDLIKDMKAVRLMLMGALQTYWSAVDAYKAAVKDGGDSATAEAAKDAAYAALKTAVDQATTLLSTSEVLAILSISNVTEK